MGFPKTRYLILLKPVWLRQLNQIQEKSKDCKFGESESDVVPTLCDPMDCSPRGSSVYGITPWTVAHEAPLCMGFSRQEYCSGLPCTPLRDLCDPGMEPRSPTAGFTI